MFATGAGPHPEMSDPFCFGNALPIVIGQPGVEFEAPNDGSVTSA